MPPLCTPRASRCARHPLRPDLAGRRFYRRISGEKSSPLAEPARGLLAGRPAVASHVGSLSQFLRSLHMRGHHRDWELAHRRQFLSTPRLSLADCGQVSLAETQWLFWSFAMPQSESTDNVRKQLVLSVRVSDHVADPRCPHGSTVASKRSEPNSILSQPP